MWKNAKSKNVDVETKQKTVKEEEIVVENVDNDDNNDEIERLVQERIRAKEHEQRMKDLCHAAVTIPSKAKVEEMLKEGGHEIWLQSTINKSGQPATVAWMRCGKKQVKLEGKTTGCGLCGTHNKADKKTIFDELFAESKLRVATLDDPYFSSAKKKSSKGAAAAGSSASGDVQTPIFVNIRKNPEMTETLDEITAQVMRNLATGEGIKPSEINSAGSGKGAAAAEPVADENNDQDDDDEEDQDEELIVVETTEDTPRTFYLRDSSKEVFASTDDDTPIGTLVIVNHPTAKIEYEGEKCIVAAEYVDKKEKYVRCMITDELFTANDQGELAKVGVLKPKKNSPGQFIVKKL